MRAFCRQIWSGTGLDARTVVLGPKGAGRMACTHPERWFFGDGEGEEKAGAGGRGRGSVDGG